MDVNASLKRLSAIVLLPSLLFILSCAPGPWLVYRPADSTFATIPPSVTPGPSDPNDALPPVPDTWEVVDADYADVTGDGAPEWILAVRRPWRDWPITAWHGGQSPIACFRDADGKSSHLGVMTTRGREVWAGSALPRRIRAMAAGDIDADGVAEVVTLEADYGDCSCRHARRIDVWKWDVFGFVLLHRSQEGSFRGLLLFDADNDGILDIIVR